MHTTSIWMMLVGSGVFGLAMAWGFVTGRRFEAMEARNRRIPPPPPPPRRTMRLDAVTIAPCDAPTAVTSMQALIDDDLQRAENKAAAPRGPEAGTP